MKSVNIRDLNEGFVRLVEEVSQGEEIVITVDDQPVAKLAPYSESAKPRQPGYWRGKVTIAEDFDAPLKWS